MTVPKLYGRCLDCQFWAWQPGLIDSHDHVSRPCKRRAPTLMMEYGVPKPMWPETRADDRCGEHVLNPLRRVAIDARTQEVS